MKWEFDPCFIVEFNDCLCKSTTDCSDPYIFLLSHYGTQDSFSVAFPFVSYVFSGSTYARLICFALVLYKRVLYHRIFSCTSRIVHTLCLLIRLPFLVIAALLGFDLGVGPSAIKTDA